MKESGIFRLSSLRISERGRLIPEVRISGSSGSATFSFFACAAEAFVDEREKMETSLEEEGENGDEGFLKSDFRDAMDVGLLRGFRQSALFKGFGLPGLFDPFSP